MIKKKIELLLPLMDKILLERKVLLDEVAYSIKNQLNKNELTNLVFICTHNSRRSHFAQVWAQTAAHYFSVKHICCYSGGTETTAMFPMVHQTLAEDGFFVQQLSYEKNPVYAIKYDDYTHPIICFSKKFDSEFNPKNKFIAIMTCTDAEKNCPFIASAKHRFSLPYNDPKAFDNTNEQKTKYKETSIEIATEMLYLFSKIKN